MQTLIVCSVVSLCLFTEISLPYWTGNQTYWQWQVFFYVSEYKLHSTYFQDQNCRNILLSCCFTIHLQVIQWLNTDWYILECWVDVPSFMNYSINLSNHYYCKVIRRLTATQRCLITSWIWISLCKYVITYYHIFDDVTCSFSRKIWYADMCACVCVCVCVFLIPYKIVYPT